MSAPTPACDHLNAQLLDYAYGELAPEAKAEVERHLPGCERCQTDLDALQGTRKAMQGLEDLPAPERGLESLLAYADQHAAQRAKPARPRWITWAMTLVPVGLAASIGLLLVGRAPLGPSAISSVQTEHDGAVISAEPAPAAPSPVAAFAPPPAPDVPAATPPPMQPEKLAKTEAAVRGAVAPADDLARASGESDRPDGYFAKGDVAGKKAAPTTGHLAAAHAAPREKQEADYKGGLLGSLGGVNDLRGAAGAGRASGPIGSASANGPPAQAGLALDDQAQAQVGFHERERRKEAKPQEPVEDLKSGDKAKEAVANDEEATAAVVASREVITNAAPPALLAPPAGSPSTAQTSAPAPASVAMSPPPPSKRAAATADSASAAPESKDAKPMTSDRLVSADSWKEAKELESGGEHAVAAQQYRAIADASPSDPRSAEALFQAAHEQYRAGATRQAVQTLSDLVSRYPASSLAPQACFEGGEWARALGDQALADQLWAQLTSRYPASSYAARAHPQRRELPSGAVAAPKAAARPAPARDYDEDKAAQ